MCWDVLGAGIAALAIGEQILAKVSSKSRSYLAEPQIHETRFAAFSKSIGKLSVLLAPRSKAIHHSHYA
jgi:hypothetical protein